MPMSIEEIKKNLQELRLVGMVESFEVRALQAGQGNLAFLDAFAMLLQDEVDRNKSSTAQRRFKRSGLEERKTMDDFDWKFNPKIPKKECFELLTLKFISQGENALLLGHPGTGKSHIAKVIVLQATDRGHNVIYREAHKLFNEMFEATQLKSAKKLHDLYVKADLLVLDDLFLRKSIHPDAADVLQEIIMDRYTAKKSTFITSNRVVEDWGKCLVDNVVASAILDRVMHHSHFLKFDGKSWRLKEAATRMLEKEKQKS